ncbi:hypothetical protein [Corynebacterium sp.]|uniref:hypothetical protein n=1 Tax=Corynebacterium sp. TaxID=1720 RepID=UPI0026DC5C12|nr:hypothetical protein [Corynebacterium sp.]MDO5033073.1 hypothetical protein [Corynebacterium sp.]
MDVKDWDAGDELQDLIIACAENDVPVPQALEIVRREWGEPDIEIPLDDVNQSADPIRRALGLGPA